MYQKVRRCGSSENVVYRVRYVLVGVASIYCRGQSVFVVVESCMLQCVIRDSLNKPCS